MNGEVLPESEELFHALIQNSSDLVALIDRDGVCRFQSPSSQAILGYAPSELVGRCVFDFVHPQDVASSRERFGEILEGRRDPSLSTELRFRHKDGSWRVIEVKSRPLSGHEGNSLYVFNSRDITARKNAEEALREGERRYRALFDSANDGIIVHGLDGRILEANRVVVERLGRTYSDLLALNVREVRTPEAAGDFAEQMGEIATKGSAIFETTHLGPEGDGVPVEVSSRLLDDREGGLVLSISRGIGERKKTEEALRESEERFRAIFEQGSVGIAVLDTQQRFLRVNPSFARFLGYEDGELIHRRMEEVTAASDLDPSRLESRALLAGEQTALEMDKQYRRKSGELIWGHVSATVFRGTDGLPIGTVAVVQDISERKQAENAARRTSAYNRSLIEAALDPLVTIGPNGTITDVNEATLKVTGCLREELVGADFSEYFTDPESARSGYEQVFALGQVRDYPLTIRGKDGNLTDVLYNASLYRDEEGAPVGVLAAARDVTERKRSEEKLRASEERFRAFYENSPDAVFITSPDGCIHAANSAACAMFGMTRDELVAMGRDAVIDATDPRLGPALRKRQRTGRFVGELTFRRKSGAVFPGEVASQIYQGDDGELYTAMIVRDLSDRKRGEEALALAEAQLRQGQKMEAVGQLAGGIAHDFNNLLTAIIGNSELMLQLLPPDDPNRELAMDVKEVGQRAAALTRQILAFSRRQMLKPEVLCLNDIVQEVAPLLRRTLGEDVHLQVLLTPDLPSTEVDPSQMEQVLMNLAVNARDAMPQGGELVIETANVALDRAYCKIHTELRPGRYVLLAVSDNGCGMDEETRSRIFEPFFTTKEVGKGTGLGLSTVFGIVRQSGGSVSVYSELHNGTTFRVYLPVCQMSGPSSGDHVPRHEATKGTETVLVVEDEAPVRELIVRVLSRSGYRVLEAGSAGEVAPVLDGERSVDLLLTDVVLPGGKSGHEVAEDVHERQPGVPVIFMSGYTRDSAVFNGSLSKEADFLEKPFAPGQLLERVRVALDRAVAKHGS